MSEPTVEGGQYIVRVKGHLAPRWADWFAGLTMTHTASGETILSGPIEDQAALHGVLAKVRDLNLVLVEVNRIETMCACTPHDPSDRICEGEDQCV